MKLALLNKTKHMKTFIVHIATLLTCSLFIGCSPDSVKYEKLEQISDSARKLGGKIVESPADSEVAYKIVGSVVSPQNSPCKGSFKEGADSPSVRFSFEPVPDHSYLVYILKDKKGNYKILGILLPLESANEVDVHGVSVHLGQEKPEEENDESRIIENP